MAGVYGRTVPVSGARNRMIEYMHLSRHASTIFCQREMRIADVAKAREQSQPRVGWTACFVKAFALAGRAVPQLRWSYLTFPYARFFEHNVSSATVAVERVVNGEPTVFGFRISQPEKRPLAEIQSWLVSAANDPVESVSDFRRQMRYDRWLGFFRRLVFWYAAHGKGSLREKHFGTFAVSSIHKSGGELLTPRTLLTTIFTYGPVSDDGRVTIRLGFDHRVLDGMTAGRALAAMEDALHDPIRKELLGAPS